MTLSDPTHPDAAFEKRVKRQVTAREHRFFVVVAPGLVSVCENELKQHFENGKTIRRVEGGLEFDGPVSDGYRANLLLRTASRITMRIADFSAADFQTLEKKCASIPWELFLARNTAFDIRVDRKSVV
jgi:putative N6-adenine-specific DNA methylase